MDVLHVILIGWAILGATIVAHELSHYALARRYGANPRLVWVASSWSVLLGVPGVRVNLRALTPPQMVIVALAPVWIAFSVVLVFLPAVVMAEFYVPPEWAYFALCWGLGGVPSGVDLRNVVNAYELDGLRRDGWYGSHDGHRSAEGIELYRGESA